VVEEAQVVVHEADEPDLFADFRDADVLTGEHATQVYFATPDADSPALGHGGSVLDTWVTVYTGDECQDSCRLI